MHRLLSIAAPRRFCLLSIVALAPPAAARPVYPLYAPYFGERHAFTEQDLSRIAGNFDFVYGQTPTAEEMTAARRFNPAVKFVRYSGNWAVGAREAEPALRSRILYYRAATGRAPLIYGNNMFAVEFAGAATWKYMAATADKPEPIAGMCIEDFMGGYDAALWARYTRQHEVMTPPKAGLGPQTYRQWRLNTTMLADCAQRGLPAVPLIINAGMKTAIFEHLDRTTRHEWERWAYASYLLCIEVRDGRCVTKLGVPMFYFDAGRRAVDIDPLYSWPVGAPAETHPAADFDAYKLAGTGVYARRFTNGLVLVNPQGIVQSVTLPEPLWNPDSRERVTQLMLPPQSGHVLLRNPPAQP